MSCDSNAEHMERIMNAAASAAAPSQSGHSTGTGKLSFEWKVYDFIVAFVLQAVTEKYGKKTKFSIIRFYDFAGKNF